MKVRKKIIQQNKQTNANESKGRDDEHKQKYIYIYMYVYIRTADKVSPGCKNLNQRL